jgi:sec-independent protein translocase protein TatA
MAGLSPAHLLIILVIALIVIGPGKLPEVGAAIGKSVREFQKASGGITDMLTGAVTPQAPPVPQAQAPQAQPSAQPYYAAQPGYPTPGYQPQPADPAPVAQPPMQYQPVMGFVEPALAQPVPMSYPQSNAAIQQPPSSPQVD